MSYLGKTAGVVWQYSNGRTACIVQIDRNDGHAVVSASSGDEAIGILKNIKFDIVLSDYKMPNGKKIFREN